MNFVTNEISRIDFDTGVGGSVSGIDEEGMGILFGGGRLPIFPNGRIDRSVYLLVRLRCFIEEFMKTNLKQWFIIGASAFLLAGCCTKHYVTSWEYKVVQENRLGLTNAEIIKHREALMNDMGKDGWIFVSQSDTDAALYFKRPVK